MEMSSYLFDGQQRIYWVYLVSSFLLASCMLFVYPRLRNYFSKEIFWHASARLDYQYFIVISIIKAFLILPLLLGAKDVSIWMSQLLQTYFGYFSPLRFSYESVVFLYTIALFVVGDFTRYWLHRFLHTVPFLWRIHRVHHSAEVLTPLTFYRVHPLENILFGLRHAMSAGVVTAIFIYFFGAKIGVIEFFGVNGIVFIFGVLGANLRHSHIPLRYGVFEKIFISPYMHQLHHTKELSHTNYGGVLSLWDRLFKSYYVAKTQNSLEFGLKGENPHLTLMELFIEPLKFYNQKEKITA